MPRMCILSNVSSSDSFLDTRHVRKSVPMNLSRPRPLVASLCHLPIRNECTIPTRVSGGRFNQAPSIGLRDGVSHRHVSTTGGLNNHKQQSLPLQGITVVSLEHAISAPFCTRQLADLGARVIKVEKPGVGDFARAYDTRVKGLASHFVWANRSKESLALDLKNERDLNVLHKLLPQADVLVQNLAPGASRRLGLGYETLRESHPSLIVCDISGYGSDGPYKNKKAYDLLIQSEAGMLSITGTKETPAKVGISIADIAAGMYAYTNILAALLQRGNNGNGSHIDISMLESMVEWMSFPLYYGFENAPNLSRTGAAHASIYPYGPFRTGCGGSVMLGVQNEVEWANFCNHVLGDSSLALDERYSNNTARAQNREKLERLILDAFSTLSVKEVLQRLDRAGIANAELNDLQGVWNHPQLHARNRWREIDTPAGPIPALIPPGRGKSGAVRMDAVPSLGQHNAKIYHELGIEEQEDNEKS
jgi:itaconate CoA-transferase